MIVKWESMLPDWVTPELALDDWRDRIAKVEAQEAEHLSRLPYVKGVAIIGSVGRNSHWPLSDVDFLVVAGDYEGEDPEALIQKVEAARNQELEAAKVPNEIEAGNWVLDPENLTKEPDGKDPHVLGIALKAQGARVLSDNDGQVANFIDKCQGIIFDEPFQGNWMRRDCDSANDKLATAEEHIEKGEWVPASREVILATHELARALYAKWKLLPESMMRGVTRLLAAARGAGSESICEPFLTAARLDDESVRERSGSLPDSTRRELDVWLAVRQANGEGIDEVAVARDMLHINSRFAIENEKAGPYPNWTGVADDKALVVMQHESAKLILDELTVV